MKNDIDYDLEVEKAKHISSIVTITILIIVILTFLSFFVLKFIIKKVDAGISKKTYYYIDVVDSNKEEVLKILKTEKENIGLINYCESIYKIEYTNLFPDGTEYTIYCNQEDNIKFNIDAADDNLIHNYIYKNGKREVR